MYLHRCSISQSLFRARGYNFSCLYTNQTSSYLWSNQDGPLSTEALTVPLHKLKVRHEKDANK
jgi:hypothetical protein